MDLDAALALLDRTTEAVAVVRRGVEQADERGEELREERAKAEQYARALQLDIDETTARWQAAQAEIMGLEADLATAKRGHAEKVADLLRQLAEARRERDEARTALGRSAALPPEPAAADDPESKRRAATWAALVGAEGR